MAAFNAFDQFTEDVLKGVYNFDTGHTFLLALTNAANAPIAANSVKADLTEIAYTNISGGQPTLTGVAVTTSGGTAKVVITDEVITASGGSVAPFRYIILYDDTPTSPVDPLIGWYDYLSDLTLANTETLTIDFDGTNGVITIA